MTAPSKDPSIVVFVAVSTRRKRHFRPLEQYYLWMEIATDWTREWYQV